MLSENLATLAAKENHPVIVYVAQAHRRELYSGFFHHDTVSRKHGQIILTSHKKAVTSRLDPGLSAAASVYHDTNATSFISERSAR